MLSYAQDLLLAEAAKTLILKPSALLPFAIAANPSATQDTNASPDTHRGTSIQEPKGRGLAGGVTDQTEEQNKFPKERIFAENLLPAATPPTPTYNSKHLACIIES